jgi:hypothetical protein
MKLTGQKTDAKKTNERNAEEPGACIMSVLKKKLVSIEDVKAPQKPDPKWEDKLKLSLMAMVGRPATTR